MCGAGEAPVPYLCDKEWHRWQPRTGWHSGDQMAFHNRTRWSQALILFFACEKAEDKQKKRLSIKIKRRVEQKKQKNYEFIQERRTENKQDKLDRLGFYLPVFCSSSQKKSNSCTFKQSCLMQNLFLRHFSMGIICILKRKKMALLEDNVGKFLTDTSKVIISPSSPHDSTWDGGFMGNCLGDVFH